MKKFKELSLLSQAILVYILSLAVSLILSPLFGKLYIIIFSPRLSGGLFPSPQDPWALSGGTLIAFFLFLSFFSFFLLREKKSLVWFIGFIFPFTVMLSNGQKYILWAMIFSAIGWLLAQGILLIRKNARK